MQHDVERDLVHVKPYRKWVKTLPRLGLVSPSRLSTLHHRCFHLVSLLDSKKHILGSNCHYVDSFTNFQLCLHLQRKNQDFY